MDADKISNMHVVQPATLAVKHVKPRRALMMALAMFFGMAGGIAYAFLYESWASAGAPVKIKEPAKGDEAIEGTVRIPARA